MSGQTQNTPLYQNIFIQPYPIDFAGPSAYCAYTRGIRLLKRVRIS